MRSLAALPLLAAVAAAQALPPTGAKCFDTVDVFTGRKQAVDCFQPQLQARALSVEGTAPTPTSASTYPRLATASAVPNAFDFSDFNCTAIGERANDFCDKAQTVFESCGEILSGVFALKAMIKVKVIIRPMCPDGQCYCDPSGNSTSRHIPLLDSDGQIRVYPQALVKQFDLPGIQYAESDILATFNGNSSLVHWTLPGDPVLPIGSNVTAFETVILHELIHGLGFYSAWSYIGDATEAVFQPLQRNEKDGSTEVFQSAYDRWITFGNGSFAAAAANFSSLIKANDTDGISALGTSLSKLPITNHSLTFNSVTGKNAILETTLNPYQRGSSVHHLDYDLYANTSDFLMLHHSVRRSGNMQQQIAVRNELLFGDDLVDPVKLAQIDKRKALGPATRSILLSMGWPFRTNETEAVAPTSIAASLPSASAEPEEDLTRQRRQLRWARWS